MIAESIAAKVGLSGAVLLDHRPHRAIEHEDALLEKAEEELGAIVAVGRCRPPLYGSDGAPGVAMQRAPLVYSIAKGIRLIAQLPQLIVVR